MEYSFVTLGEHHIGQTNIRHHLCSAAISCRATHYWGPLLAERTGPVTGLGVLPWSRTRLPGITLRAILGICRLHRPSAARPPGRFATLACCYCPVRGGDARRAGDALPRSPLQRRVGWLASSFVLSPPSADQPVDALRADGIALLCGNHPDCVVPVALH